MAAPHHHSYSVQGAKQMDNCTVKQWECIKKSNKWIKSHSNKHSNNSLSHHPALFFANPTSAPSEPLSDENYWTCSFVFGFLCSDIHRVLREDKEKLKLLYKCQPRFSEEQKKELIVVHPWIKKGSLPKAIDVKVEFNFHLSLTCIAFHFIGLI